MKTRLGVEVTKMPLASLLVFSYSHEKTLFFEDWKRDKAMKYLRKNARGVAAILLPRTTSEKHGRRLKDLTPAKFACSYMAACPAVLKDRTDGSYLIIGQACDAGPVNLSQRVGKGEALIKISGELLEGALAKSAWRKRVKYGMAMASGASLPYLPQLWTLLHSQFAFLN